MGQTRIGLLADPDDKDMYRFFLGNWDHIRLTITPPADGIVEPDVFWYGRSMGIGFVEAPGEPVTLTGLFPPGDYHVALTLV